jgi:hypothetical protein
LPPAPADPRLLEEGDAIAARLDLDALPEGARLIEADYRLMRAELTVDSPHPFRARYKQFYFPGWKVTVDGHAVAQIATAPHGLLGFDVPAGRHTIVVRPTTTPLRAAGNSVSILAFVVAVALVLIGVKREPSSVKGPSSVVVRRSSFVRRSSSVVHLGLALLALLLLLAKEAWIDRTENVFRARRFDAEVPGGKIRGIDVKTAINFGNAYTLYGYDLPRRPTEAGDPLRVDLYLAARQPPGARPPGTDAVRAYVRLVDRQGRLWSLPDNTDAEGHRPPPSTEIWPTDAYGHGAHLVQTLPGTPPGTYWIQIGLFEKETWAPLNVLDPGGQMVGLSTGGGPVEIVRPRRVPGIKELDLEVTLDETAAPGLRLLGTRIEHVPQRAGDPLSLALYWQAEAEIAEDYGVSLAVRAGGQRLSLAERQPLGRVDHPTLGWKRDEVVRSLHTLRLPASTPGGPYTVEAVVVDPSEQPAGPARTVAAGELAPIERQWSAPAEILALDANLGGQVTLLGYTTSARENETQVTLYWQAQHELSVSWKVFVQWISAGQTLAQDDAVPGGWQRPTTGWMAGEVVPDVHILAIPASPAPGEYTLIAGMYDEATLQRLPLFDASGAAIGDHVVLERRVVE